LEDDEVERPDPATQDNPEQDSLETFSDVPVVRGKAADELIDELFRKRSLSDLEDEEDALELLAAKRFSPVKTVNNVESAKINNKTIVDCIVSETQL
jgi:hypothetical protein